MRWRSYNVARSLPRDGVIAEDLEDTEVGQLLKACTRDRIQKRSCQQRAARST